MSTSPQWQDRSGDMWTGDPVGVLHAPDTADTPAPIVEHRYRPLTPVPAGGPSVAAYLDQCWMNARTYAPGLDTLDHLSSPAPRGRRLLVTGSRLLYDGDAIETAVVRAWALLGYQRTTLVHGDCPTGADALASRAWQRWGLAAEAHPADWDQWGKAAGPRRNQEMVDTGVDLCVAFPTDNSRGTRNCMGCALNAGVPVIEVSLDGSWELLR